MGASVIKIKAQIMSDEDIRRTLTRLSHQIIEKNHGVEGICLVGIKSRGVPLAERIAENIKKISGEKVEVGKLDITPYRDDLASLSVNIGTACSDITFSTENKTVILVDDVIYTGRTSRAAMDALLQYGRAAKIQLAVLVDRGHRELPISATFAGKNIPTSRDEEIAVRLNEFDGADGVFIYEK